MIIDNQGRVGIGATSPASLLHLEGNTNSYNTAPLIYFGSTSTANAAIRDWAIGPADSDYGRFHIFQGASTGSAAVGTSQIAFTINSNKNVGIGTADPLVKLTVAGPAEGNPATSGTTQANASGRFFYGGATLDIGHYTTGTAWIVNSSPSNLSTNSCLLYTSPSPRD